MGVTVRRAVVFAAGLWCLLIAVQWAEFEWSLRRVREALEAPVQFGYSGSWDINKEFAREARRLGWVLQGRLGIRRLGSKLRVEATVTRRVRWGGVLEKVHEAHLTAELEMF